MSCRIGLIFSVPEEDSFSKALAVWRNEWCDVAREAPVLQCLGSGLETSQRRV